MMVDNSVIFRVECRTDTNYFLFFGLSIVFNYLRPLPWIIEGSQLKDYKAKKLREKTNNRELACHKGG
jgi:hypothetical protein